MVDIKEAKIGDCIYAKLTVQQAPVFAEITRVLDLENALEIRTDLWGTRVVIAENAYWEEKLAKKGKIVKIQNNYTEWAKEHFNEKAETDNRIDTVHHGQSAVSEDPRETSGTQSVQKRVKRKQKVVRKSTTKRRKPTRSRKTRSSKK
tara:strand:- start:645 stop:1088 length:444 start_codon:yes stop_codon:yes gene_type:complete